MSVCVCVCQARGGLSLLGARSEATSYLNCRNTQIEVVYVLRRKELKSGMCDPAGMVKLFGLKPERPPEHSYGIDCSEAGEKVHCKDSTPVDVLPGCPHQRLKLFVLLPCGITCYVERARRRF